MILRVSSKLVPKGYAGITLYPFVLVRERYMLRDKALINHESIHIEQQKELLVIFFFLWYGLNYLWNLAKYRNHNKAYRNIIFEREAYGNERNLNYLKSRKVWAFWKYIKRKK